MITITRRQARRLRAVFRRHALGIAHKGAVPPLVFRPDPTGGLRVRHNQPALAVEHILAGDHGSGGGVALPLDALADLEGRDDAPITLEAATATRTVARWSDRGIPRTREYAVPDLAALPPFPDPPAASGACPAGLIDALAEASATTDEASTRYALGCLQLRGDTGEVVATDGRQVLIQGGFAFPWDGDVLARRTPFFAARDLPRDRLVEVGRAVAHVVVRVGPWSAWLATRPEGRFPRLEHLAPPGRAGGTRLRLDPGDSAFLRDALGRLPGGDACNAPVTLDLGGGGAVVRAAGDGRVAELSLSRSACDGPAVRVNTSRHLLARALGLGFAEVVVAAPDEPVACRDGRRAYLWQPLSADSAIAPSADAVHIDSADAGAAVTSADRSPEAVMPRPDPATHVPAATGVGGLAALIREAEGLGGALAEARSRTQRLVAALRRHRKQSRLVASTLASLEQLRLQGVAAE